MSPRIRAPLSSIKGQSRRKRRRASAFVNQGALKQWLSAAARTERDSAESAPSDSEDNGEESEPRRWWRGRQISLAV